jgi:predicted transcriptional regulator
MATTTVGIKMEKSVRDRLKVLGHLKDRTPHWLVRRAVEEFLDREERWEQEKREDDERWERYLDTGESYSRAEVSKWMKGLREGKRERWPR